MSVAAPVVPTTSDGALDQDSNAGRLGNKRWNVKTGWEACFTLGWSSWCYELDRHAYFILTHFRVPLASEFSFCWHVSLEGLLGLHAWFLFYGRRWSFHCCQHFYRTGQHIAHQE